MTLDKLSALCDLTFVQTVVLENVAGQQRKLVRTRKAPQFYCVKMTAAIQIEGVEKGMQTYEERYVLVKAASRENA